MGQLIAWFDFAHAWPRWNAVAQKNAQALHRTGSRLEQPRRMLNQHHGVGLESNVAPSTFFGWHVSSIDPDHSHASYLKWSGI